jgi:hypothetical protein
VKLGHALVAEAVAYVGEEESASGFSVEESLILVGGKLEVAINIAALESEVQGLLALVVGN